MTAHNDVDWLHQVVIPIFEFDETGTIKPNPLFHRPHDRLHSRCIEYPFAASQLGDAQCILDVGTVKADPAWIAWLENLPIEVHASDYDEPNGTFHNVTFHQADVRELPISDNTFDKILAVSVIEHIGLHNPQVVADELPQLSVDGDVEAVRELIRVLKRGGELILTTPFGPYGGLILGNDARNYTMDNIRKFEEVAEPVLLQYYEYQHRDHVSMFSEYTTNRSLVQKLGKRLWQMCTRPVERPEARNPPALPGEVTWRNVPMENAKATHYKHVDGVLCSVWRKH